MTQNALLFSNWQSDSKKCSLQEIQIVEYKYSLVIIAIQSFNWASVFYSVEAILQIVNSGVKWISQKTCYWIGDIQEESSQNAKLTLKQTT